jgi:hypothetical protein
METVIRTSEPDCGDCACEAIDLSSPVSDACWRALRGWLEGLQLPFEPTLSDDVGLVGYSIALRNYLIGIGLNERATGPVLTLTAVLCRGMDRETAALGAVDRANRLLAVGQLLYVPGPPAELTFHAAVAFDLLDGESFALLFEAMLGELNNVGFPAVMAVGGYHPTDYAAPWGDPMRAPIDDDPDDIAQDLRALAAQTGCGAASGDRCSSQTDRGCGCSDSAHAGPAAAADPGQDPQAVTASGAKDDAEVGPVRVRRRR